MIFYTIQGPSHVLEIHNDKIKLSKKSWLKHISKKDPITTWEVQTLTGFEISAPKRILWGKIEWRSLDGNKCAIHFSTNPEMVRRIEKYMQKMILKNIQRKKHIVKAA